MSTQLLARPDYLAAIKTGLARTPVTALLGPRQVGKTTLARQIAKAAGESHYFDLEDPDDLRVLEDAKTALAPLTGLIVIDEIQRRPELFPVMRVLVDRPKPPARFLVLGSASPQLLKQTSESLAGRIEFVELSGLRVDEVSPDRWRRLWLRGGFPRAFLAASDSDAFAWLKSFVLTYLERDLPQFGLSFPGPMLHRFWTMVAHFHGQTWNASVISRSLGISDQTTRRYLDVLSEAFLVRQLQPWFENVSKRQVKAPKIYLRDSGVLHRLLDITSAKALSRHPRSGASWEGFVIEHILRRCHEAQGYFWATHSGAELDLMLAHGRRREGFEFKMGDAPGTTKSMHIALGDLGLDGLAVVYPGDRRATLAKKIELVPLAQLDGYLAERRLIPATKATRQRRTKGSKGPFVHP